MAILDSSRRIWLCALALCFCLEPLAASGQSAAGKAAPKTGGLSLESLRQARAQLAHRKRRVIANNDGCDCLYFAKGEEPSVANFLAKRTTGLAGTHVDTIAYCSISAGFSNFTHRTKVGSVLTRSPAEFGIRPDARNIAGDLIRQGTDCLQVVVDFSHQHGMEAFWSMRMNDTHDAAHQPAKPFFLFPPLKYEHPEWLVGEPVKRTPFGRWSSVDYARPEIRDLAFRYVEEVCRNYDVDGIELDFFRHLCYFKSTAMGGKASQAEREAMTDMVRRIRAMTEEVGIERGRPILVSVRAVDSLEYDRDMGLDVGRWLEEGLFDMLITTCYFQLNPWQYSVDLGHKYGVVVYPCLSDSRVTGETRFRRASPESYRGRAMNAWAAGADGIHLFNLFDPRSPVFREVGDPQALASKDKLYFVTVRDGNPNTYLAKGDQYLTLPVLTPAHARTVTPASPLAVDLYVGDDFGRSDQAGLRPKVTLHLEMSGIQRAEQIRLKINGQTLSGGTVADGWIDMPVPPSLVQRGANRVELAVDSARALADDEWNVIYDAKKKPAGPWRRDRGSRQTEEKLVDGSLLIADRGTSSGDYLYYRIGGGADPGSRTAAEARVKVVSGSSYLIVSDDASQERIGLWPDHIGLWSRSKLRYDMDTTRDFHTYRVVTQGQDLKVFVDGTLRIDGAGLWKPGRQPAQSGVAFGASNSPTEGAAYWNSVKARTASSVCQDIVLSVRMPR